MVTVTERPYRTSLRDILQQPPADPENIALWWLGQAGFALRYSGRVLMIDPYLSNCLARKYKGKEFPHLRMMAAPILPEEVPQLDVVLCTHGHSDHFDPETIPILAKNHRECVFVAPKAVQEKAAPLVATEQQLILINAGERIKLAEGISVEAIAAAHEGISVNERGEHYFLGYLLKLGDITLYHSGDCTPYPELEEYLQDCSIDIALLPINGRDEYRRSRDILGNFTLREAVSLCQQTNIPIMIAHHFGMFAFNTVNIIDAERESARIRGDLRYFHAQIGITYDIKGCKNEVFAANTCFCTPQKGSVKDE